MPWPAGAAARTEAARQGTPCLLVVRRGAPIPAIGELEDWTYHDADERDVAARLGALERRASPPDAPAASPTASARGLAGEHS